MRKQVANRIHQAEIGDYRGNIQNQHRLQTCRNKRQQNERNSVRTE